MKNFYFIIELLDKHNLTLNNLFQRFTTLFVSSSELHLTHTLIN